MTAKWLIILESTLPLAQARRCSAASRNDTGHCRPATSNPRRRKHLGKKLWGKERGALSFFQRQAPSCARYMARRTDGYLDASKGWKNVFSRKLFSAPLLSLSPKLPQVPPSCLLLPPARFFWPLGLAGLASPWPKRRSARESSAVPFIQPDKSLQRRAGRQEENFHSQAIGSTDLRARWLK